jgi:hypothetical protein
VEAIMLDILEVIKNVESIYTTNSNLSVLKDFERVLDEMDLYVYENWEDGELVSGPHVDRHWIKASFMWPLNKMPNPMGGKRLLDYGCRVNYEKTFLVEPRKIEDPDDIRPGTQKGKLDRKPVWVVQIVMPKKLASDIFNGYMTKMKENMGIGRTEGAQAAPAESADTTAAAAQPAAAAPAAAPAVVPGAV